MKPAVIYLLAASVVVAGCDVGIDFRPNTTFARAQQDDRECEAWALRKHPVRIVIERERVCAPDTKICDDDGNCRFAVGLCHWEQTERDINEYRRDSAENSCMTSKGYARVSLPHCPVELRKSIPPKITKRMPAELTENMCVIRHDDGLQIVTL